MKSKGPHILANPNDQIANGSVFRSNGLSRLLFGAVYIFIAVFFSWPNLKIGLPLGILFIVLSEVALNRLTVFVGKDGVLLYGRHWLAWSDVVSAKRFKVPFFPYLIVKRREGPRWWIPLYFIGKNSDDIRSGLLNCAPDDNPVTVALSKWVAERSDGSFGDT